MHLLDDLNQDKNQDNLIDSLGLTNQRTTMNLKLFNQRQAHVIRNPTQICISQR
jgi:hypothetical protein